MTDARQLKRLRNSQNRGSFPVNCIFQRISAQIYEINFQNGR